MNEISQSVQDTLNKFYGIEGAKQTMEKASGALVFPSIYKGGLLGFGGSYGNGELVVKGQSQGHYSLLSASFGFQLGIQAYSLILVFLTDEALNEFVVSDGWQVGVNASVAIITIGAGATLNTDNIKDSVAAVVFDNQGLMYSLSLEGTKISKVL